MTYCYAWSITRSDGVTLRYTTHNNNLDFLGEVWKPSGATDNTYIQKGLGLSVDNLSLSGGYNNEITFEDVRAGLFDNAKVEGWRVNHRDTSNYKKMFSGYCGEFSYSETTFTAEVRDKSFKLTRNTTRLFSRNCPYRLGDTSCGVDLTPFTHTVTTTDLSGDTIAVSQAFPDGVLDFGLLVFEGNSRLIRRQVGSILTLWDTSGLSIGNTVSLIEGCNKTRKTCKEKFSNVRNFGGFDLIPPEDILTDFSVQGKEVYDGSSYFERI